MRILILGSGGREHALAWKLNQSPEVKELFSIPGNAGISDEANCMEIALKDFHEINKFIEANHIDLTVVGPEQPLVEGIVDYLEARHKTVFGPNRQASALEGSKIFAKNFMKRWNIPTAQFEQFADHRKAVDYIDRLPEGNIVVKADGLAAGKGSIVCQNRHEAKQAIHQIMVEQVFHSAGNRLVVEEFMTGDEASLFVITDGDDFAILSPAQDFKRARDGDEGKNTGGMGSYAPTAVLSDQLIRQATEKIVIPVLDGLKSEGIIYKGMLYCGLMMTDEGPQVVEFNCRFGDPETQVVLPLLASNLPELLLAVAEGRLARQKILFHEGYAVCVIAASGGYPDKYEKGKVISGLDRVPPDVMVFHAGTRKEKGKIVTAGGRVLGVTAVAPTLKQTVDKVYSHIQKIHFDHMHYRKDIAAKAIQS